MEFVVGTFDRGDRTKCTFCDEELPENSGEKMEVMCPKCGMGNLICRNCGGFLHPQLIPHWYYDPITREKFFLCCGDCMDAWKRGHPEHIENGPVHWRDLESVVGELEYAIGQIKYFTKRAIKQYGDPEETGKEKEDPQAHSGQ